MDPLVAPFVERIREAAGHGTPLAIRGGGTKDFLAERIQGDVLDARPLAGVVAYEPTELVVTVRAGTPLGELEALLAERGQCLPFEPPHFGPGATVGGMIASGLSGPARASVGAVRDYVLGVTLLNGRGELLTFGGQVMKNVAGYDVSRLVAGSYGTLGLITQASLKVLGRAPAEATLRFECDEAEALRRLNAWGGQPLPLNASCWQQEKDGGALYLRLRGAAAAVDAACRSLGGERMATPDKAWHDCREQTLPWFAQRGERELWRLSVPQTAPKLDLPEPPLVEWHGAQRWVRVEAGAGDWLRRLAEEAGGHATLFRSDRPTAARFHPLAPAIAHIHHELKRQFDPADIFNRGRLYADL
ncbi:MAG: glycolate oxidase subunit GlcE [Burkholderiales bacterium]|nr:glycolate oxidase subunit GlcE [Burkholderiales bacterium]